MTPSVIPAWLRHHRRELHWLLPAVLGLAALFAFWRLGAYGVRLWDETRYGENAYQMLQRGDFINYYYDGVMDDWVAKPPLGMWLIALAYKLVGFNEWALRLPSALAGIGAVGITFKLVEVYKGPVSAALVALILITCRGILGPHVSRTGDLDALYVVTALGVVYFMACYGQRGERKALLLAAVCAGLCFFSKGFMLLLFLPGLGLYLLVRGRVLPLLKEVYFWLGVAILGLFIGGWYLTIRFYGNHFPASQYGKDAWDVMVQYDILRRFTEKLEGDKTTPAFVFEALDVRFSPWLYLLYISAVVAVVQARGHLTKAWRRLRSDDLLCLAVCMSVTTCVVLGNSATKFNWYFAIVTPFLAVLTLQLVRLVARRWRFIWALAGLCAVLGLGMQALSVAKPEDGLTDAVLTDLPLIRGAKHIYTTKQPGFNTVLALKWRGRLIDGQPPADVSGNLTIVQRKLGKINEADGGYSVLLIPGEND